MLKPWMKWLPLVLVEAIARRNCERLGGVYDGKWCTAFKDVLIKVEDRPQEASNRAQDRSMR